MFTPARPRDRSDSDAPTAGFYGVGGVCFARRRRGRDWEGRARDADRAERAERTLPASVSASASASDVQGREEEEEEEAAAERKKPRVNTMVGKRNLAPRKENATRSACADDHDGACARRG